MIGGKALEGDTVKKLENYMAQSVKKTKPASKETVKKSIKIPPKSRTSQAASRKTVKKNQTISKKSRKSQPSVMSPQPGPS